MNAGMLEKLFHNFDQKQVRFSDKQSNFEQKHFELPSPEFSAFFSFFSIFFTQGSPEIISSPDRIDSLIPMNGNIEDSFADKIAPMRLTEKLLNNRKFKQDISVPSDLLSQTISHDVQQENKISGESIVNAQHFDGKLIQNHLTDKPQSKKNELHIPNFPLFADGNVILKFNRVRQETEHQNPLPNYEQSINQIYTKTISTTQNQQANNESALLAKYNSHQLKSGLVKNNFTNKFVINIDEPEQLQDATLTVATKHQKIATQSANARETTQQAKEKLIDNKYQTAIKENIYQHLQSKMSEEVKSEKITDSIPKEEAISQKAKTPQGEERIFNQETKPIGDQKEEKLSDLSLQPIKNQIITKNFTQSVENTEPQAQTPLRFSSRLFEIPSKLASIVNSQSEIPVRAEIQLQPRSLGMVVVTITASRSSVEITMQVKDKETLKALETQITPLREKLTQLGFERANVDLQFSQWNYNEMTSHSENKNEEYQLRRNFLRSFAYLKRSEVEDFQKFFSNQMGE